MKNHFTLPCILICVLSFLATTYADLPEPRFNSNGTFGSKEPKKDAEASKEDADAQKQDEKPETKPATKADLKKQIARGKLERKIAPTFRRTKLVRANSAEKAHADDFFVVAVFNMPLATRDAELRFEVKQGIEDGTKEIADYLQATPQGNVRDFRVVSRFKSESDAQAGVQFTRQRYDQLKQHQSQMLAYMQQQQQRARSMRRC